MPKNTCHPYSGGPFECIVADEARGPPFVRGSGTSTVCALADVLQLRLDVEVKLLVCFAGGVHVQLLAPARILDSWLLVWRTHQADATANVFVAAVGDRGPAARVTHSCSKQANQPRVLHVTAHVLARCTLACQ